MVYNPVYILLNLVCYYFVKKFASIFTLFCIEFGLLLFFQ